MSQFRRRINSLLYILLISFTKCAKLGNSLILGAENVTETAGAEVQRDSQSGIMGEWGDPYKMRLIPIHSMLLPDGCVLGYGTNAAGKQRADLYYEIWDVGKGIHEEAHMLLEHSTKADMFCSTLNMDISTGNILIFGGDLRDDGKNLGSDTVLELNYKTHEIQPHAVGRMNYQRWYATSINLPNGEILIVGGKSQDKTYIAIPEVWSATNGFRALINAEIPAIAGSTKKHWWYPHVYVSSRGAIFIIMPHGNNADIYHLDVEGEGTIKKIGETPFKTHVLDPSIMYRPDKVLFLDEKGRLWTFDMSENPLVFRKNKKIGKARTNGFFSLLPDGRVAITGGCSTTADLGTTLSDANYSIQIWNPDNDKVFDGGNQQNPRLYHSTSLTLPDGTVVSAGGGAPGPVRNLNGQLYRPDYLFNEDNKEAVRPVITRCPKNIYTNQVFTIRVGSASQVKRITASKSGASSHARNCDARWVELDFEVLDKVKIRVTVKNENVMIPGLWTINTLDKNGVPSKGCLLGVNTAKLEI